MKKGAKWVWSGLAIAVLAIQLIPIERSNPPVQGEITATATVMETLRRSCYDCHSNETVWPWYSRVAPVSWLVASDVSEGREHLNFSSWARLSEQQQTELKHEIWEVVSEGEMPLWFYLPLHPEARLSDSDLALLQEWSRAVEGGERDEGER